MRTSIRFKNQDLTALRRHLLQDRDRESYALLLARTQAAGDLRVLTVMDVRYPSGADYVHRTRVSLEVSFDTFVRHCLCEADERVDVDCVIDVHTHPFSKSAWFSATDNEDEVTFCAYLHERGLGYASVVFSQTSYAARFWDMAQGCPRPQDASLKAQTALEEDGLMHFALEVGEEQDRSVRALGLEGMRRIVSASTITVVGVGGIGSVVAEHLVHMGFSHLRLVDHDRLEVSNMNRIVGATMADARRGRLKVEAVAGHLRSINPKVQVETLPVSIFDDAARLAVADSDWVLVATDNHASRLRIQELCFEYFVPFITAGVNITVEDGVIRDMSGEVILVRMGDHVCLSCLGRVDYDQVARETHPDAAVRTGLVERGYVSGADVHEPAVKTLNTHLATMLVDTLVNQYTGRRRDPCVLVFEDNDVPCIFEDRKAVEERSLDCAVCGL